MRNFSFILVALTLVPLSIQAYDFKDGKLCYNIVSYEDLTCEVAPYDNYTYNGDYVIPATATCNGVIYSVIGIGEDAFYYSYSVSVTMHNKLKYLKKGAFNTKQVSIKNSTLPDSLVYIGDYAFAGCSWDLGELIIPDKVTYIGDGALILRSTSLDDIKSVTIGNNVTHIGADAFSSYYYMTSLSIGNSVEYIGDGAFYNCSRLEGELTIPNSVTYIGDKAFYNCSSLTSLTIGDSVEYIGSSAFYGCSSLTGELLIPNSVTEIGGSAFYECRSLTSLTLSNNVEVIGSCAFYNCKSLTGDLIIPNSVTEIDGSAFYECSSLTSLVIGNSVEYIGSSAFYDCLSLTGELIIPKSVTEIGYYTFYNGKNINSLFIEDGEDTLLFRSGPYEYSGYTTFSSCTFETLYLGRNIEGSYSVLGNYSPFQKNGYLKELTIGNMVTHIDSCEFEYCSGLISVSISNSVITIAPYSFTFCDNLTTLVLGNSVEEIGAGAFQYCSNLENIYLLNSEPPTYYTGSSTPSFNNYSTCVLHVPLCFKDDYLETAWRQFKNIVEMDFDVYYEFEELRDEIYATKLLLRDAWVYINSYYTNVVDYFKDNHDAISDELDNLLVALKEYYNNGYIIEEQAEKIKREIEEIKKKIEELLEAVKQVQTYCQLYTAINCVWTTLDEIWDTITTEYPDLVDDLRDEYENLKEELEKLLQELEDAYNSGSLDDEKMEEIRQKLEDIKRRIDELLAPAVPEGIRNIHSNSADNNVQIYNLSGARVNTPTKGNVYIFRFSDGTTKKVLIK